jgi:hypothetical protein
LAKPRRHPAGRLAGVDQLAASSWLGFCAAGNRVSKNRVHVKGFRLELREGQPGVDYARLDRGQPDLDVCDAPAER